MAPNMTKQEVREVLLRQSTTGLTHAQNFYNCIVQGDNDFIEQYGGDPTLKPGAKAAVRNSKILYYVKQLLLRDLTNYSCYDSKNSFYVRVENRIIMRFKKLDEHGRSSSSKTNRDLLFRRQENCIPFDNESPSAVNMDVGYHLDALGMNIIEVFFSCPKEFRTEVHWSIPAKKLGVVTGQQALFAVLEEDVLPVLDLDLELKDHLKKNTDEQKAGSA